MKKVIRQTIFLLLCLVMVVGLLPTRAHADGGILICVENFPDVNFRNYISNNIDRNKDGVLSDSERLTTYNINVPVSNISTLEGIRFFPRTKVLNCYGNKLTYLDVSCLSQLEELQCTGNSLTYIDVSQNKLLTSLKCSSQGIRYLDLSNNLYLERLECSYCNLTSLDVSPCTLLRWLNCGENNLTSLNVTRNTKLESLAAYGNKLTTLNISKNPSLKMLSIIGDPIKTLDISNNPILCNTVKSGKKTEEAQYVTYKLDSSDSSLYVPLNTTIISSKPKITTQPKAVSVKAGKKATFKIKASGDGLSYQWYYQKSGTTKWVKMSGKTKATLSFTAKKSKNGYKYRCLVTNPAGKVYSKAVKLKVK